MSSSSSPLLSRINVPRIVLWLASIVVAVLGYVLMAASNANESAIYTAGKADYPKLFAAQSGSTIGGLLIAVGVLGALLALASMAITWRPPTSPEVAAPVPEAAGARSAEPDEELDAEELDAEELDAAELDVDEPAAELDEGFAETPPASSTTDPEATTAR